jgi:hypothetical protein
LITLKTLKSAPTRFCKNKTRPGLSSATHTDKIARSGESTIIAAKLEEISKARFKPDLIINLFLL